MSLASLLDKIAGAIGYRIGTRKTVIHRVWDSYDDEAVAFIRQNIGEALLFHRLPEIHSFAMKSLPEEGQLLEFGVFKGSSINFFARRLKAQNDRRLIHGFDSFIGLKEKWSGTAMDESHFSLEGALPPVEDNVRLHKGWIEDTLPGFLKENDGPVAFVHIDTDSYSPAKLILSSLKDRLRPGSLVLFDEMYGYPNWQQHELKALEEVLGDRKYTYIAFCTGQALIRIDA